jgi:hypothetical protein
VAEWQTRRTQNPLPARACGFKSHLRHLFSRGFSPSGVGRLPRTNWRIHSEPITRVLGNGFAWPGDRLPNPLLPTDSAEDPLFNAGFYWEAHEAWDSFWHALGRTTPEAQCVQGLIHLTAACVKIREGKTAGVKSHTWRARELMAIVEATNDGDGSATSASLGIAPESLAAVSAELENDRPECWHTSRFPVVKVPVAGLRPSG